MPYIIRIEKVTKTTEENRAWVRIRDIPDEKGELYGYAPPLTKESTKTEEVFKQTVEDISLVKVIEAVNGMRP